MKAKPLVRASVALLVLCVVLPQIRASDTDNVSVELLGDDGSSIVLAYTFGGYRTEPVFIEGEAYEKIWIPGEPVLLEKGSPALPHVNRSVIIPDDAQMSVRVLSATYEDSLTRVVPSKGALLRTVNPDTVPFVFGEAYASDAFYPGPLVTLAEPYIMRDHRGLVIQVNPFQHNPATGLLRFYTSVTVEVFATGPGGANVFGERRPDKALVQAFDDIYRTHFVNYAAGEQRYAPIDEQGDMLIIAHDPWISDLDPFVSHKSTMGITATVVGVSTIGNDPTSIKDYIQQVYDTSDLAFVLLVGDAAEVATPTVSGGASDPTYSKLAGADDYPEILVGRFSAQTAAELDTQVQRTIDYESLPATGEDWFKRGTGIASAEGLGMGDEGQSDKQHMAEIRTWLLADGYTEVDEIYDPGATDTQVHNALNAGRGVVNYCGHGNPTAWGTTGFNNADVNALVNDNMLPFIVSVACNNGEFNNYGTCFAEAWLRATHDGGAPTGAIGMYASSVSQSWAPPMEAQDEFNLLLTDPERPYHSYGALCFAGSSSMMDAYGGDGVAMFNTWNIFGDPSLYVVGDPIPTHGMGVSPSNGLSSTGPAGGPCSPEATDYTLTNYDETPIDYEVTCAEPWVSISSPSGTIPAKGSVVVTVRLNEGAANLDHGGHADTVSFVNVTNRDGDTTRPVSLSIGSRMPVGRWMLDADPGWMIEGEWEYGTPSGRGGGHGMGPDPTGGFTGTDVYGVNLGGNFSKAPGGPYYLTLGPLDLTGIREVSLSYRRWLNSIGPPSVLSTVDASATGTVWTNVWSAGANVADSVWVAENFDISSTADDGNAVHVRWGYQVQQREPHVGSGWNIDDVLLEGEAETVRVTLSVEPDRLAWSSIPGAVGYDVVRGDLGVLVNTAGDFGAATEACLADDLAATSIDYTEVPAAGAGHWFLARGVSLSGPLTYQSLAGVQVGMRDEEIAAAGGSCP